MCNIETLKRVQGDNDFFVQISSHKISKLSECHLKSMPPFPFKQK